MWVLKKINDETTKYLISEKKSYTVGRKNCDFAFDEDSSISRKHCTLFVAKKSECPFQVNKSTGVWLVEEQSKYGTFVRNNNAWVKIIPGQDFIINHGCIIKFGLMENIWRFEYKPLIVCTSGIQTNQKNKIENILRSIDGELKHCWHKGCSVIVVNEITLTVKVVLALILGVPIVTSSYIEKVVDAIKNQTTLPKYEDHQPEIKESALDASLVSLDIKHNRKELFKGKKFLIPTKKQFETLKEVITSAGGEVELLSLNGSWDKFAEENTIVIQTPLNDSTVPVSLNKLLKEIAMYLQNKHKKRIIPESEIAQAVAYSSIKKYCNPKSNCFILKRVEEKKIQGDLLVEETPDILKEKIPDSLLVPNSATLSSQYEVDFEPNCSKILTDKALTDPQAERKRAHSPFQLDECQKKKPKKGGKSKQDISDSALESSSVREKQFNDTVRKSMQDRVNSSKSSEITNYFKKLGKPAENIQEAKEGISDFWNYDSCKLKRKNSTETKSNNEILRKKAKLLEKNHLPFEPEIDTFKEVVKLAEDENAPPAIRRDVEKEKEKEKDFAGYFGKDRDEIDAKIDILDCTIFSTALIPPMYLKADGSLTEPPEEPVNIKKFRKQKVQSVVIVNPMEHADEELSDGEWIEPHPREVTVGEKNW